MSVKLALAHEGHTIAHSAGHVDIALTLVRDGVFKVSVNRPGVAGRLGFELDGCSYGNEREARAECRRMFRAYFGRTVAEVDQRRAELVDLIERADQRRGPEAVWRASRYRAEQDAIAPLRQAAQDRTLAASITDTMSVALADALVPAH